ncbi:MAG TPA: BTAD domain-containing putative transcriptional regulator [Geomonas sp.]|nr:BTAD domain-containing putative transcriptional regulator [Geomonas sp.]
MHRLPTHINKISPPAMSGVYQRTRLFEQMDKALARPVAWIEGPAGSGKSTLVASYLESRGLPHIWYHLDEGDTDCATLFYYLGLAAQKATSEEAPFLPLLTKEFQHSLAVFTRRYFETLFSRLPERAVLVFDDYHVVTADSPFHQVIQQALEEIPPGINVVLISREPPPPTLSRLRSRRRLSSILWKELRLDAEEVEGVAGVQGVGSLGAERAERILAQTGGWFAGLVFMLEGGDLGQKPPAPQEAQVVFDYFACEVFEKIERPVQEFLVKTSFMREFTPLMATQLTGNEAAGPILATLNARNYFTDKYVDGDTVYQYHPLFREFLIRRAADFFPPEQLTRIKLASASLLEVNGRTTLAAELYTDTCHWTGLSRLFQQASPRLIAQGRTATIEYWIDQVPRRELDQLPWLLYGKGICRFQEEIDCSREFFQAALALFRKEGEASGIFLSWAGIANSFRQSMEDWQELEYWLDELDAIMAEHPVFPSLQVELRLTISKYTSLVLLQRDHQRISRCEERLLFLLSKTGNVALHAKAAYAMLHHELWRGNYARMRLLLDEAKTHLARPNPPPFATLILDSVEVFYHWVTARPELCRKVVEEALQIAGETGLSFLNSRLEVCRLQADLLDDRPEVLQRVARELEAYKPSDNNLSVANYYFCWAMLALRLDDIPRAANAMAAAQLPAIKIGSRFHQSLLHLGQARVLTAQGRYQEAHAQIRESLVVSRFIESRNLEFMGLLITAWLRFREHDDPKAREALGDALAIGREHDYLYCMWWDPRMIAFLCLKALEAGIEEGYVQKLIRHHRLEPEELPLHCCSWPWPVQIYAMGDFEIAVDGSPLNFSGKVQKKPIELLKALIALGGAEKKEGQIADLLWPEAEGDTAKNSLKITLHRLRQLIRHEDAVQLKKGKLVLNPRVVWSDAAAFESALAAAQAARDAGRSEEECRLLEGALALFRGQLLAADGDKPWAAAPRARLLKKFTAGIAGLADLHRGKGNRKRAVECYLGALEASPHSEELYQGLMECYLLGGLKAEALSAYRYCRLSLAELGATPSRQTEAIYRAALEE